jgi:hypothetical protein
MSFHQVHSCKTKAEVLEQLEAAQKAIMDFYRSVPYEKLNCPGVPEGWSPARNMKHVISTNKFFGLWIGLPAWFLRLFGKPDPRKTVEASSPTNRPGITDYGTYPGSYPAKPGQKEELLRQIDESGKKFGARIAGRTEEELDTLKGAFGGMSLRAFALFVLKHNMHHTGVAKQRLDATD